MKQSWRNSWRNFPCALLVLSLVLLCVPFSLAGPDSAQASLSDPLAGKGSAPADSLVPALIDPPKDAPSWPPLSPEGFAFETERSEYPAGFDSLTVTFTNTGYDFIGFQRSTIYIGRKIADGDDRDPGVWRYYAHSFGVREVYFPGLQVRLFRGASASFSLARAELVGEDDKREGPPYFPPGTYQLILCNQISSAGPESYFGGVRTPSFTLTAP